MATSFDAQGSVEAPPRHFVNHVAVRIAQLTGAFRGPRFGDSGSERSLHTEQACSAKKGAVLSKGCVVLNTLFCKFASEKEKKFQNL
jgi:hypothetical protein